MVTKPPPPLCVFCSAPWTDEMVQLLDVSSTSGCPSCGYGAGVEATLKIVCSSCDRLVYEKEFKHES